jgi:hypothetical protein
MVAETQKKLMRNRLPATCVSRSDGGMTLLVLFFVGLAVGVTTVLFGFGGGFVTVPIILLVDVSRGGDAIRIAVATSALVMVVNAIIATVSTRTQHLGESPWSPGTVSFSSPSAARRVQGRPYSSRTRYRGGDFVAYIVITVVDLLLRPGFLPRRASARPVGENCGPWTSGRTRGPGRSDRVVPRCRGKRDDRAHDAPVRHGDERSHVPWPIR